LPDTDWFFPPLGGGEESGLNEAGIEQFKKGERLPRETIQNTLDNRAPDKLASGEPAVVTFERLDLRPDDFPGRERFTRIFRSCRDHVLRQYENEGTAGNEKAFFENGLRLLGQDRIPTLRIGDDNTTGLHGSDDDRHSPYWRLIRGQGYSSQQGSGGGTYGIGQRAPFAHSALRTILYSTRTEDGNVAFVAKSILASFRDPEHGFMTQSKGWWGHPSEQRDAWRTIREGVPDRYRRTRPGTDIYVTGYERDDWRRRVRWSVFQNFFAAIATGDLEVRLRENGEETERITRFNLEELLIAECDAVRMDRSVNKEERTGLIAALYYLRAFTRPHGGQPLTKEIDRVGRVKLFLVRDRDAPDRWCCMRRPKSVVESSGSSSLRGYAAVLLCDSEEGNEFLAQLEDPAHERWHEDEARGWSPAQRKEAREARLDLRRFVLGELKRLRNEDQPVEQDVPNLGRYLPIEDLTDDPGAGGTGVEPASIATEEESGLERSKDDAGAAEGRVALKKHPGPRTEGEGGRDDKGPETPIGRGRRGPGQRDGTGDGNAPVLSPRDVRLRSYRTGDAYTLVLEAPCDMTGSVRLVAVGESGTDTVEIESATSVHDGRTLRHSTDTLYDLELTAGTPLRLRLELASAIPLCVALGA